MLMVYLYTPLRVEPDQVLSSSLNPHSNLLNPNFTYQSLTGKITFKSGPVYLVVPRIPLNVSRARVGCYVI